MRLLGVGPVLGPDEGNTKVQVGFDTAIARRSLGIHAPILLPLRSCSVEMAASPGLTPRPPLQVNGTNFVNSAGLTCIFGDRVVKAIFFDENTIFCVSPAAVEEGLQAIEVKVSNNRQQYTSESVVFDYYAKLNISSVTPSAGPVRGGTLVFVEGQNFIGQTLNAATNPTCRFGLSVVQATLITSELLTCLAPTHDAGTFTFALSLNDQQYTAFPFYFTFYGIDAVRSEERR